MQFIVSSNFFNKVPKAYFGVIIVRNFDNQKQYDFTESMLKNSIDSIRNKFNSVNPKESNEIIPYREAFRALDINPNKYMCSIEALISRIVKGNDIPSINPIVDICNAISIKYILPIGVHDIDNFDGDIEIREAVAQDEFVPFNSLEIEHPDLGEIIYVSGNTVKTRRWTWRQGEKSKIDFNSKNMFIPIDGFSDVNLDKILAAQQELVDIFKGLNLDVVVGFVDIDHSSFKF